MLHYLMIHKCKVIDKYQGQISLSSNNGGRGRQRVERTGPWEGQVSLPISRKNSQRAVKGQVALQPLFKVPLSKLTHPSKGQHIICSDALLKELCVRKYHQAASKLVHNHHSLELWNPSATSMKNVKHHHKIPNKETQNIGFWN